MRTAPLKIAIALTALLAAAALAIPTYSAYSSSSANVGSTFATAASYSTCPDQTITTGHLAGFESGRLGNVVDRFSLQQGAPVIDGTVARTGGYSLRVAPSATTSSAVLSPPGPPTTMIARFAVRLASLPAGNVTQLFGMTNTITGTNRVQLRYVAATQKLALAVTPSSGGTPTVVQASSTVTAGAWNVVEIRYAVATSTHAVDWQINEVAQTGVTLASTAAFIQDLVFGTGSGAETFTANYDDALFTTSGAQYPLGDGRIRPLRPNGMGTHVGAASFTDDDGTPIDANTWQRLDEAPMNTTNDFIQMTTAGPSNYAEITLSDTTETCIRAAEGVFTLHSSDTKTNTAKISMFDGTRETELRRGLHAAAGSREYGKLLQPNTTWSQSALNGLLTRFGYADDVSPIPIIDAILVEYEVPQ